MSEFPLAEGVQLPPQPVVMATQPPGVVLQPVALEGESGKAVQATQAHLESKDCSETCEGLDETYLQFKMNKHFIKA